MAKNRIYQDIVLTPNIEVSLNKRNSHYLTKVLRLAVDDNIILFNGDGYNYFATIMRSEKDITVRVLEQITNDSESALNITLVQAIGKGDKMDFIIQKAVELGVSKIIPIITTRTIFRAGKKDDAKVLRWQEVAINSCEQCGRSIVPKVENITKFSALNLAGTSFILDPLATDNLLQMQKTTDVNIIIGPEGGFTPEELDNAKLDTHYTKLSLGTRVLRTETAGIATLAGLELLWNN